MQTKEQQRQQITVTMHQLDRWLDREGGAALTLCGIEIRTGDSQRAIDMSEVVSEVSCPLCECAALLADVQLPRYEQPALF